MKRDSISVLCWRCGFALLLSLVIYLSWNPSPGIAQVSWIPRALGVWFDQHDFLKNLIGYGLFAFTGFMAWSTPAQLHSVLRRFPKLQTTNLPLLICFCSLVVLLELGQLA